MKTMLRFLAAVVLFTAALSDSALAGPYAWAETVERHPQYYAGSDRRLLITHEGAFGAESLRRYRFNEITGNHLPPGSLFFDANIFALHGCDEETAARLPETVAVLFFGSVLLLIAYAGRRHLKKHYSAPFYRSI